MNIKSDTDLSIEDVNNDNKNDDLSSSSSSSCPFSMHFPRYEIPLSSPKTNIKNNIFNNFLKNNALSSTIQKSKIQNTYSNSYVKWIDCTIEQDKDYQGIYATTEFWRFIIDFRKEEQRRQHGVLVLYGLDDNTIYKNLYAIYNWWHELHQNDDDDDSAPVPKININLIEKNDLYIFEIASIDATKKTTIKSSDNDDKRIELEIASEKRMKSWVKRILVDLKICPFTKSTNKSGQGLNDVPVGNIWYCYSHANMYDIPQFMYDTWDSLSKMYKAGPSGKNGISSILLSVPSYDTNFPYWSGPIFTILQSSVIAAKATSSFGVVCFHPQYATPDGTSWPGFGQMHSVPRLRSWLQKDIDNNDTNELLLSNEDIAAGGAWQRRTPHAIVNVLRADQLEKAEKKRSTKNLYVRNIHVLVGDGTAKDNNNDDIDYNKSNSINNGIGNDLLCEYLEKEKRLS